MQIMAYRDLLDFAIDEKTGVLVDIRRVQNGMRCGCVCPECKRKLVAKKGPRNRHHFAHLGRDQKNNFCSTGPETGLHKAAKTIISRWQSLMGPALFYSETGRARFGKEITVAKSSPGKFFPVDRSVLPDETYWPSDWVPDVVFYGPKGELRVEIKVSNGISDDKQLKIERDGVLTLEYDVAKLRSDQGWNLTTLEHALKTEPSLIRWVFNPRIADLREEVKSELAKQIYENTSSLIKDAPVFGESDLVFHPWFGLVPKELEARQQFINQAFAEPNTFSLRGGSAIKIRQHGVLKDSWLISFFNTKASIPRAGYYDSLLSEHLNDRGCCSRYFGIGEMRIVWGRNPHSVILDFVQRYASPDVKAVGNRNIAAQEEAPFHNPLRSKFSHRNSQST